MDNRREFFREFFPKWFGFDADSFTSTIQVVEALKKLERLVEDISAVWTSASGYNYCEHIDPHKLKLGEVRVACNGKIVNRIHW